MFPPISSRLLRHGVRALGPSFAAYGIPYRSNPNAGGMIAPAVSGQALTSNGPNAPASFQAGAGGGVLRSAKTFAYTVVAGDKGSLIDTTSGTWTLTLTAPATLGNGWWAYLKNSGTGDITLSPASGNIDGLASYLMYPGEARIVMCDGSNFYSIVLAGFRKSFTANGTFTAPPGYQVFKGLAWGGGGGGGKGGGGQGGGGGGGAAIPFYISSAVMGASQAITIGAGGAGKTGTFINGVSGGGTTIGSLLTAYGGGGGGQNSSGAGGGGGGGALASGTAATGNTTGAAGGNPLGAAGGGTGVGGDNSYAGGAAGGGTSSGAAGAGGNSFYGGAGGGAGATSGASGSGGTSVYGGGGGGSSGTAPGGAGGTSVFGGTGGAGGNVTGSTSGTAGSQPGGGGGGANSGAATSGAGGNGQVDIYGVV